MNIRYIGVTRDRDSYAGMTIAEGVARLAHYKRHVEGWELVSFCIDGDHVEMVFRMEEPE